MPPPFGWPDKLVTKLDKEYPDQWMFTGSFAMYCLAAIVNQPCRDPLDIDIVMADKSVEVAFGPVVKIRNSILYLACSSVSEDFGSISLHRKQDEAYADGCMINQSKVKIDFGVESEDLGFIASDRQRRLVEGNSFPLISPTKLLQGKRSLALHAPTSKHAGDVATMEAIVKAMMPDAGAGAGPKKSGCCVIM